MRKETHYIKYEKYKKKRETNLWEVKNKPLMKNNE